MSCRYKAYENVGFCLLDGTFYVSVAVLFLAEMVHEEKAAYEILKS